MTTGDGARTRARWARLRFQIVGPLLARPPEAGELRPRLEELAGQHWKHPTTGEVVRFGVSTIERWYYQARNEPNEPVRALERQLRSDAGQQSSVSAALSRAVALQHKQHPQWSYLLHYDNLVALAEQDESLGSVPSYTTVRRFMKAHGLVKQRRRRKRRDDDGDGGDPLVAREMRSFEVEHVHGLWHLDFHEGSRSVVLPSGERKKPQLLGILDDRSRLACHLQWYLDESAESLVHGLSQALQKRGRPRSLVTDNGAAMIAAETREGLERLSIVHYTTLPYTPEQNAKQESFWGQIEGRLLPMLEGEPVLTLDLLNRATQAWVEREYNQKLHSEIGQTPLERFLAGPSLGRACPSSEHLRRAFRMERTRTQRRSDGTVSIAGRRFELPNRYRTLLRPVVRFARWDLSVADLVDPLSDTWLCAIYPVDKQANASGRRSALEPVMTTRTVAQEPPAGIAPLLSKLMADYAASGLPPAYLPMESSEEMDDE